MVEIGRRESLGETGRELGVKDGRRGSVDTVGRGSIGKSGTRLKDGSLRLRLEDD